MQLLGCVIFTQPNSCRRLEMEIPDEVRREVVVESGFSKVREEKRESAWHDNDGGWAKELGELKAYLEAA
jgi:hypothetical protein